MSDQERAPLIEALRASNELLRDELAVFMDSVSVDGDFDSLDADDREYAAPLRDQIARNEALLADQGAS